MSIALFWRYMGVDLNRTGPLAGRVLVADDDPAVREMAHEAFRQDGHSVALASDGDEACRLFSERVPDVVLMDIRMPVVNGFEACARLRRQRDGARTPVLMMSGFDDADSVERAYGSGATDFQAKPLNWRVVRERVRYMLHAKYLADYLHTLAQQDGLTGLENRTQFRHRLERAIASAARSGTSLGVIFFDLDGFKRINDTFGHGAGDQILRQTGERLTRALRSSDLLLHAGSEKTELSIGRMGGDEFTILAKDLTDPVFAHRIADRVRRLLDEPFDLEGTPVRVTASIGVATYPQDGRDAETLLAHADAAMYYAKNIRSGTGRGTALPTIQANELRTAIERDELCLRFQPKFDLSSGRIAGAEALIRWRHPVFPELQPFAFVGLAEQLGLGVELGVWATRTALRQSAAWSSATPHPFPIAVNLSHSHFRDVSCVETLARVLRETKSHPGALEVEVMESVTNQNRSLALERLRSLSGLGVRVAIDNVRSRHSALRAMRASRIHTIKLDRAIISQIVSDECTRCDVAHIIGEARRTGTTVVAEGVERLDQLRILADLECHQAQGFLLGKGALAAEFGQYLEENAYRDASLSGATSSLASARRR